MPFEIVSQNDYLMTVLKGICIGGDTPTFTDAATKIIKESKLKYMVIQCSECSEISTSFLRELAGIYKTLKASNGGIRLVNVNATIKELIVKQGLDRILPVKLSLRGALVDFGLVKQKEFDVNFINPFLTATMRVLKVQCFLETKNTTPKLKQPSDPLLFGDISGIIAITSETFNGTLAISLPEKVFLKIATNMLGEPHEAITENNIDIVGELANIILGQAKIQLIEMGYKLQMALPSCVWGKDHKIKHFGGGACVVIPFETEAGTFYIEVMSDQKMLTNIKGGAGANGTGAVKKAS